MLSSHYILSILYDTDHIENTASNSSVISCVFFFAVGTCLPKPLPSNDGSDTQTNKIICVLLLTHFPYFEEIKVDVCDHYAVYIPLTNFWLPEPICMNLYVLFGTWGHLNCVLHKYLPSVRPWVCMYEYFPLSLQGSGSVQTLPRQRIHTQQYKNSCTHRFLCGRYRIKGK
jgi:hypothetical protein